MQRCGCRLAAGSFISPRLSTGGAHTQASLPGAALPRGGGEELRGLHGPRGQLCQVSTHTHLLLPLHGTKDQEHCCVLGLLLNNLFSCYNTVVCYIVKTGSFYGKKNQHFIVKKKIILLSEWDDCVVKVYQAGVVERVELVSVVAAVSFRLMSDT